MAFSALLGVTIRGLLSRRRLVLMVLLALIPVAIGLIVQLRGGHPKVGNVLGLLVIQTVMPLVALIFGTASLGSEVDDGTAVYLLVKPVPRWIIALAKILVAVAMTAILVIPSTVITGVLLGGFADANLTTTFAFALACLVGGTAYAAAFVALSSATPRALIVGLVYVLLWEGALGGLLEGTRFLSIRQATLGIVGGLGGQLAREPIDAGVAAAVLTIAIIGGLAITSWRLARFEIKGGD
jgi:ABC-2 type transport system permease protein